MTKDYDVIIVGGRPAGSTLAARLGRAGLKTLLLERADFPSRPAASSPIIYSPTMALLDEIGADEAAYAKDTPRLYSVAADTKAATTKIVLPEANGRNYAYAIDRARFDAALWDTALSFPNVEGRMGFNVTDLLRDGDQVSGVIGHQTGGQSEQITADIVVGADGRFSMVARKVNAGVIEEHDDYPTSLYYAYWKNVQPFDATGPSAVAYEGEFGYGFLVMDSADGTTAVTIEGQADMLNPPAGKADEFYLDLIKTNLKIWQRLQGAEQVTKVHGMRRIGNMYRQPGGAGWALSGDAYHQHDPLDGQGIFNAVYTAKTLARAIKYWKAGDRTWDEALAWYDETARAKTYASYKLALNNVKNNIYSRNPLPGHMIRWMMEDPLLHWLSGKSLTREIPAELITLMTPPVMVGAMMAGPLRDLRRGLDEIRERLPL